jgi:hypothetical protein
METTIIQQQQTIHNLEQELFEIKRKFLSLEEKLNKLELEEKFDKFELEERINKLEEQKSQSFSVTPFKTSPIFYESNFNQRIDNSYWNFCDINCTSIKIDIFFIYFNDCRFELNGFIKNQSCFLKQFQNIKVLEIDINKINWGFNRQVSIDMIGSKYNENGRNYISVSLEHNSPHYYPICWDDYKLLVELLLSLYKDIEIIFKATNLNEKSILLFQEFMKSTNYRKLHIEIKDNLVVSGTNAHYVSQPYVNETKEHCISNNIEFTSNIGL